MTPRVAETGDLIFFCTDIRHQHATTLEETAECF